MAIVGNLKDHPRYGLIRDVVLMITIGFLGSAAAIAIVDPFGNGAPSVPTLEIGGIQVPTGKVGRADLMKLARARLRPAVSLVGPGIVHRTNWAQLGASVDLQSLDRLMLGFSTEGSIEASYFAENASEGEMPVIPLPISIDSLAAVEALVALKDIIDTKPQNAVFDIDKKTVAEEKRGLTLDVYKTLALLDENLQSQSPEVKLVVDEVPAEITKEDLAYIEVGSVLGFFETRVSRMSQDRDRTYNVNLGASRLDGQVIMPGQVFSFNDILGERSEARGFRFAPVIAGGMVVEGMGGGTCQVASTLNAAAFFAGLVVVERRPHSRPSSYIKLGLDATVSYPSLDLKLKNPFDFPVVIHFKHEGGILRAEFRGKDRLYTIAFIRKLMGTKPYPIRVVDDSKLEKGQEVITQNGIPGYTVRRYQIINHNKVAYRFQTEDRYPPTAEIVSRGVAEPGSVQDGAEGIPKPDTHRPYRAHRSLRMVQGEGLWYEQFHE
jgi:vancomycin resistance protein YoaR